MTGQRDLVGGLSKFFEPAFLAGDNQYEYEGTKVDAVKCTRLQKLPPILTFCLKVRLAFCVCFVHCEAPPQYEQDQ